MLCLYMLCEAVNSDKHLVIHTWTRLEANIRWPSDGDELRERS